MLHLPMDATTPTVPAVRVTGLAVRGLPIPLPHALLVGLPAATGLALDPALGRGGHRQRAPAPGRSTRLSSSLRRLVVETKAVVGRCCAQAATGAELRCCSVPLPASEPRRPSHPHLHHHDVKQRGGGAAQHQPAPWWITQSPSAVAPLTVVAGTLTAAHAVTGIIGLPLGIRAAGHRPDRAPASRLQRDEQAPLRRGRASTPTSRAGARPARGRRCCWTATPSDNLLGGRP